MSRIQFHSSRLTSLVIAGFTVAAVAYGTYARFAGLGERQLAVDEYFFITSSKSILKEGVPQLPSGGYYMRGVWVQYLTAGSIHFFGDNGFAYRFPQAILGLISCCVAFFYSRRHLCLSHSALVSSLLFISSWSIEFSRFARPYMAFQIVTVLFALAVELAYGDGVKKLRYLPHGLFILTCLTHRMGILMAPILIAPLLQRSYFETRKSAAVYLTFTSLIGICCFWYVQIICVGAPADAFPAGYTEFKLSVFRLPIYPFWNLTGRSDINLLFSLVIVMVCLAFTLVRTKLQFPFDQMLAIVAVASSIMHMLTISFICLMLMAVRYRPLRVTKISGRIRTSFLMSALFSFFWIAYAVLNDEWINSIISDEIGSRLGAMRQAFFGWPDYYTPLLLAWQREMPWLGMLIAAACLIQIIVRGQKSWKVLLVSPIFWIAYFASAMGVLNSLTFSTRYTFFIYPIALCTLALSARDLLCMGIRRFPTVDLRLVTAVLVIGIFALAGDFNYQHVVNIRESDVAFRLRRFSRYERTWYGRHDYESAAKFVNGLVDRFESPRVILFGESPVSYYLDCDHIVYLDRNSVAFFNSSRSHGTLDKWSGMRLLSTKPELERYIQNVETVVLIRRPPLNTSRSDQNPDLANQLDSISSLINSIFPLQTREFVSHDGRLEVWLASNRDDGESG